MSDENELQSDPNLEFLRHRRGAYVSGFTAPGCDILLEDLAKFCRANQSCFDPDPRIHAALEGRREVWLRIQQHLNLKPSELLALYNPEGQSQ